MAAPAEAKHDRGRIPHLAEGQEGRYELYNGIVYAMSPERAGHAEVKHAVASALAVAIAPRQARMLDAPQRHDRTGRREYGRTSPMRLSIADPSCRARRIEVPSPVIVVEVLSPSTRHIDASAKLAGYFRLPSTRHYLIVDADKRLVIHHARGDGDAILTRIVKSGSLDLSPPGLKVPVAKFFVGP